MLIASDGQADVENREQRRLEGGDLVVGLWLGVPRELCALSSCPRVWFCASCQEETWPHIPMVPLCRPLNPQRPHGLLLLRFAQG